MGWEIRRRSRGTYYYITRRQGGKVVKRYIGRAGGPLVNYLARSRQVDRAEEQARLRECDREQALFRSLAAELDGLRVRVRQVCRAHLTMAGFRPQKGAWIHMRRPRTREAPAGEPPEPVTQELFDHLVDQAARGHRAAAGQLQQLLETRPDLWSSLGDLTRHAEDALLELIGKEHPALRLSLGLKLEATRKSLRGSLPGEGLDGLLTGQILVGWLEVEYTRAGANQPWSRDKDTRFWTRRYEQARKQFSATVGQLIRLRELLNDGAGVPALRQIQAADSSL